MSPRSEEFMASAQDRLRAAHAALGAGFPSVAVSAAYYAVLYAGRAALSEQERNAKTHRGVWSLFGELFVSTGRLDSGLFAAARRIQELREAADYDARDISADQARAVVVDAESFVAEVVTILGG
jgi:uncharacterized protein (UPF0332 family)